MKMINQIKKYAPRFNRAKVVAVGALMTVSVSANAGPVEEVVNAVKAGFTDANTIAIAVVVGFAGIFAIMLAKRLLR